MQPTGREGIYIPIATLINDFVAGNHRLPKKTEFKRLAELSPGTEEKEIQRAYQSLNYLPAGPDLRLGVMGR